MSGEREASRAKRRDLRGSGPGLVFALPVGSVYYVGIVAHVVPTLGDLCWFSGASVDHPPQISEIPSVINWKGPLFIWINAGSRAKDIYKIGYTEVPEALRKMPTFRLIGHPEGDGGKPLDQYPLGRWDQKELPIPTFMGASTVRFFLNEGRPPWDWERY